MRFVLACFSLFVLLAGLSGCAPATEPAPEIDLAAEEEAAREAIEEMAEQWDAAMNAGDYEAVADLFTDDGIQMGADAPALVGKAAIRNAMKTDFEENTVQSENVTEEIRLAGDWAVVRGTYKEIRTPKAGGEPIELVGKWLDVYERQADGSWKISRDAWNLDHPLPAPSE